MRRRSFAGAARTATLCTAGLLVACTLGAGETSPNRLGDADLPRPIRESDFRSPLDLLHAIRDGSFDARAGIEQEIAAARPARPAPVRIDFVMGSEVPKDQASKLQILARELADRDDLVVDVVGCSDASGPAGLNQRISQQRAKSVAWALEQFALPARRIGSVEGRGEACDPPERAVFVTPRDAKRAAS